MLKRNSAVKLAPQRWQDNAADGSFDVVFAFEEKVFDMVVEGWYIPFLFCYLDIMHQWNENANHEMIKALSTASSSPLPPPLPLSVSGI